MCVCFLKILKKLEKINIALSFLLNIMIMSSQLNHGHLFLSCMLNEPKKFSYTCFYLESYFFQFLYSLMSSLFGQKKTSEIVQ